MDIQTEKIKLAKMILSTNDTGIINQIKSLFKSKGENWWDELPEYVKEGISESLEQADRGEFISYDEVKKEVNALLKK
jgi:PhoPQ-activated pathogenicity-related protein